MKFSGCSEKKIIALDFRAAGGTLRRASREPSLFLCSPLLLRPAR